jgi:hypothetical protein
MTITLNSNNPSNNVVIGGIASGRKKFSRLHIKLVLDGTGSTGPFNPGVNAIFSDLVTELPLRVGECYFGLHVGRDWDHDLDHDVNLGDNLPADEITKQMGLVKYEGGGDELETQIDSLLYVASTTAWKTSEGARLAIVLATSSDSKNARDGSTGAIAGTKLGQLGIRIIVIAPKSATNVHDLARYSGGQNMILSNTPSADELKQIRDRLTKSLTQIAGTPATGTVGITPNTKFGSHGTVALGSN